MDTILNTVLNRQGEVVGAFFGDTVEAFNEGVKLSKEVYAVEIPEEADIVISSSHPCDLEFWQAHKTQYPSDLAVKAGGTIIIVTPCYEGVAVTHSDITGDHALFRRSPAQKVEAKEVHDEVAAALAIAWAQVKERESVYLVLTASARRMPVRSDSRTSPPSRRRLTRRCKAWRRGQSDGPDARSRHAAHH